MKHARSIVPLLATVTFLLSVSASATYADDADTSAASAAPAFTRLDKTPIGKGTGRLTGRSYSTQADVGVKARVFVFNATPYTKWFFGRVFDEWDDHKPNTPWPVMDDRVLRASVWTDADDGGYFSMHGLPVGNYYVVQFGNWTQRTSFYSSVFHDDAFLTLEPVSVTAGKVTQIDRSDEREVDEQCPDHEDFASICRDIELSQFVKY